MQKAKELLKKNLTPSFTQKQLKIFSFLGIVFFFLFVLFTLIVREDVLRSFDFNATVRLQNNVPLRFDEFFSFLSVTGRFEMSLIILSIVLFIRRKILGLFVVGLFGIAHVIEVIGKSFLTQPGPPHMFLRTTDLSQEFPGLYIHTNSSYPSGHSMRVIILSIIIAFLIYRWKKLHSGFRIFLIGTVSTYAFLMLLSRVSLGEHWATDVTGGALLGFAMGFFSLLLL